MPSFYKFKLRIVIYELIIRFRALWYTNADSQFDLLKMEKSELKARFVKVYSNLPINVRKEIIVKLEHPIGPVSWEIAYREISEDTELGEKIVSKLSELSFI